MVTLKKTYKFNFWLGLGVGLMWTFFSTIDFLPFAEFFAKCLELLRGLLDKIFDISRYSFGIYGFGVQGLLWYLASLPFLVLNLTFSSFRKNLILANNHRFSFLFFSFLFFSLGVLVAFVAWGLFILWAFSQWQLW
jgi:hypothetical protein